jgi:acyl-CoA hydrolase
VGKEVWRMAFLGSITAIAAQRLWRSQIMTSKMMHITFGKWFNVLDST